MDLTTVHAAAAGKKDGSLHDKKGADKLMVSSIQGDSKATLSLGISSVSQSEQYSSAGSGRSFPQFAASQRLFGRTAEMQQLHDALARVCNNSTTDEQHHSSEIVVIKGRSGTGKSALAETLRSPVVHTHNGFFVAGKFDQLWKSDPFSALTACFTDLCDLLLQSDELELYRERLQTALGSEISALESLIPNLCQVMGNDTPESAFGVERDRGQAFTRFRHLCRSFINAVATPEHPILLFLDDLQWSDSGSIDILSHALIQNIESNHILVICAYRDDPTSLKLLENKFLPCIAQESSRRLAVTEIQVRNLTHKSLHDMLAAFTGLNTANVLPLGELVMMKTRGNCYFVRQFLEVLLLKGLLVQDPKTRRFSWDIDKIQAETNVSTNVVALVMARIQSLPVILQEVITMAAFLGFTFDERVLTKLLASERSTGEESIDVSSVLQLAVEQGLLEETAVHSNEFKFSHDRIQQVLYMMVDDKVVQQKMHLRIGRLVKQMWDAEQCEKGVLPDTWKLFIACDQLNDGAPQLIDRHEKMDLVRLNLQTAKVAIQKTALIPAAGYMRKAILIVESEDEVWTSEYHLCLDLYGTTADIEYSLGNFEESTRLVAIVRDRATCTKDALRVNFTTLNSLGNQGEFSLALDLAVDLLSELAVKLPRKPGAGKTLASFYRTRIRLHGWSYSDLAELPPMKNEEAKAAFVIIGQASVYGWYLWDLHMLGMCTFKMIELTLRHGITESTSFAFAGYGSFLMQMGHRESAYQFGKLALALCESVSSPQYITRTLVLVSGYLNHYKVPIHDSLPRLMEAYRCGHSSGETAFSSLAACAYLNSCLYTGRHLRQLMDDGKVLCGQMEDLGQDATYLMSMPLHQTVLHLAGFSDDPLPLSVYAMDSQDFYIRAYESGNVPAYEMVHLMGFMLALFFNELDMAQTQMKQIPRLEKPAMTHFNGYTHQFLTGWCYFACWDGKKKFLAKGRRCLRRLEGRVKVGSLHLEPFVHFLKAEQALALGRETSVIRKAYDEAIASTAKHDLPNYEALANERAGRALNNDTAYLGRAFDLYIDRWGALAKAKQVKELIQRHNPSESQNSDTISLL